MLANFVGLVVSWILKWISNAAEEWHQLELRDRRNRKIVTDAVKEAVDAARIKNVEIADSPEPIGASIDRLREFGKRRAAIVGGPTDRTLLQRGVDAARERETSDTDSGSEAEVSPTE